MDTPPRPRAHDVDGDRTTVWRPSADAAPVDALLGSVGRAGRLSGPGGAGRVVLVLAALCLAVLAITVGIRAGTTPPPADAVVTAVLTDPIDGQQAVARLVSEGSETRVFIDADLPSLDDGWYALWLLTPQGEVAAALGAMDPAGVILPVDGAFDDAPIIAVTRERPNGTGAQTPSNDVALRGDLRDP